MQLLLAVFTCANVCALLSHYSHSKLSKVGSKQQHVTTIPSNCFCLRSSSLPLQYMSYKKLIGRWDSERELSLRRHRTRTTKYNRLVHKFCHRSTRLCVETQI